MPFWEVINLLLILPMLAIANVNSLYNNKMAPKIKGQKDVYYRALANQKLNWRNILLLFVKRYLSLETKFGTSNKGVKCLIFDDTDISKTGKKIEGVSTIFNHVSKTFIFGYKLLLAGYWNGCVFIPVDFSFHRENKNNNIKKYGLTAKEFRKQKKTQRNSKSPVFNRFKELNSKKNEMIVQMYKRINQRKIAVDYILIDSWFTSMSIVSSFLKINKKVNIIGMYKYNSKVVLENKTSTIKQLRKSNTKLKRSRKHKFYYKEFTGKIDEITVKVFTIKKGKNGAWHTIISTDTKLRFVSMIEIYHIRWSIEVFFKEAKQLLGLGKNQSTNFDVQIAQTTITMIQYLLISLKFREQAYETIHGLFKDLKQDYIEHKLNERILIAIVEIIAVLELLIPEINFEETISNLILYSDKISFLRNIENIQSLSKLVA